MKFSFSKCLSLGYIDFLDTRKTALAYEGPQFPLTCVLSGDGSYFNPFQLDFESDPMVKSVGVKTMHIKVWKKFVQNLNSKLSSLQFLTFNWFFKRKLFEILKYINTHNVELFHEQGFRLDTYLLELSRNSQDSKDMDASAPNRQEAYTENYFLLDIQYLAKKKQTF